MKYYVACYHRRWSGTIMKEVIAVNCELVPADVDVPMEGGLVLDMLYEVSELDCINEKTLKIKSDVIVAEMGV